MSSASPDSRGRPCRRRRTSRTGRVRDSCVSPTSSPTVRLSRRTSIRRTSSRSPSRNRASPSSHVSPIRSPPREPSEASVPISRPASGSKSSGPWRGCTPRVLRRIIRSLGVTSAEALAAYTRFEYNMGETRLRLREFEAEGWLAKGFLARGERTVLWAVKDGLDEVDRTPFRRKFVLTPMDNLFLYLRESIVDKFHMGSCYVVFDGAEMVAAFKAKRRKWQLLVTEFQGEPSARRIVEAWEGENELAVEEQVDRISDHEVMEWYAKMYGRGAA